MGKYTDNKLVVGLDIGTSKVVAHVADVLPDGKVEIIGLGSCQSKGLKKGVVVNIDSTVYSIQRAIEEAELMAGCQIKSVVTGIAGRHIRGFNSHGIVGIKNKEVTKDDVDRVIDAAKAVAIPADQKILHVLPREFIIDSQEGIYEPIGMSGVRLESKVHIVTGALSAAQNIVNCIRRCGLDVEDMVLEQLASSYAVLTEDEKHLGVCMLDIGGGTTDVAIFIDGSIIHTYSIPVAGDQVSNDLAVALRTGTSIAEEIKIKFGCAKESLSSNKLTVDPLLASELSCAENLTEVDVAKVIEPRFDELFKLVSKELYRTGLDKRLGAGIVLTGGSSRIKGVIELAEQTFKLPVRLGMPRDVSGLSEVIKNPQFATGVGLLLYKCKIHKDSLKSSTGSNLSFGMFNRVKHWFQGNF